MVLAGLGTLVVAGVGGELHPSDKILLSPALGYIVACGALAISTRLGYSAERSLWVLSVPGAAGALLYGRELRFWARRRVRLGVPYVILSAAVCLVYFLPGALRDGVVAKDGSFHWMYVDTQFFMAMAASVKTSVGAPKMPGLGISELSYHYGPYALSAAVSATTGVELADAYARIVRGASQLILLASAVGLGRILGRGISAGRNAGILGGAGLFFYGSLGALFASHANSSSSVPDSPIFKFSRPDLINVIDDGGPFSHILLGHSVLNGMIGITAVFSILLAKLDGRPNRKYRPDISILLPALTATINVFAGFGVLGVYVGATAIFGRKSLASSIVSCVLTCAAFFSVAAIMGYIGGLGQKMELNNDAVLLLYELSVWFYIGLGIRVFALYYLKDIFARPASAVLALTLFGFVFFDAGIVDIVDLHNRYGIKFLQPVLSIFAFVALAGPIDAYFSGRKQETDAFWRKLLTILFWSSAVFITISVAGYSLGEIRRPPDSDLLRIARRTILLALLSLTFCLILHRCLQVAPKLAAVIKRAAIGVYLLGCLAWIPSWVNMGLGHMKMDIVVSPGELRGLRKLRSVSKSSDLFATDRHLLNSLPVDPEGSDKQFRFRSYSYAALLERRVLLEGWAYRERYDPLFPAVKRDNDLLFTTMNSGQAKRIVERYGINYIVVSPGADVHFMARNHEWIRLVPDTGTLRVYEVLTSGGAGR